MPTVDANQQDGTMVGAIRRVSGLDGQSLLTLGAPMAGKSQFVEQVAAHAGETNRDALHIAATRGYNRLTPELEKLEIIDCSPAPAPPDSVATDVGGPSDLTGISMPVSRFLQQAGPRPIVTLDSITTLLMYQDAAPVFRFLSVLTAQLRQNNGIGLFLMEKDCHEETTVKTFQQVFDGRIDVEAERTRIRGVDGVSPGWFSR